MITDKDRLDWLEQHSEHTGWLTVRYPSLRAAIDSNIDPAVVMSSPKSVSVSVPAVAGGGEARPTVSAAKLNDIRLAVAIYIGSEGCSCCRGWDHDEHKEILGRLLRIPKYSDGSGRDFASAIRRAQPRRHAGKGKK